VLRGWCGAGHNQTMAVATAALTREDELYWIALRMVPGLGTRRTAQMLERFRTPRAIFGASRSELEGAGLAGTVAQSIASGCAFEDAAVQQQKMLEAGAFLVPIADRRYPAALREIFDPPAMLFVRGRAELLETVMLGVVGTRRPTPYGLAVAERLSGDLAMAGFTIISGMARGIDTAAHRATLAVNGNTIAVFGCGVDVVYPAENRKLAAELAEKGLLISEFPMGSPSVPQNFPIRNRIIAGSGVGVMVVEGAQYSGSAITAKLAMEAGKEVFAVPGNITSAMSWGPNLLIKQGAKLVQEWHDVMVELPAEVRLRAAGQGRGGAADAQNSLDFGGAASPSPNPAVPEIERWLLSLLRVDAATHLDVLVESGEAYSTSEIIAALFELEMRGVVRQMAGKNFVRVW
jgi:DNA processing protein